MLYDSIDEAFRCFIVMFNNTNYGVDTLVRNFTKIIPATTTALSSARRHLSPKYFSIQNVAVLHNEGSGDISITNYDPMELRLPYLSQDIIKRVRFIVNFEFADMLKRPEAVQLLVYAYTCFVVDAYSLARSTDEKSTTRRVLSSMRSLEKGARAVNAIKDLQKVFSSGNEMDARAFINDVRLLSSDLIAPLDNRWRQFFNVYEGFVAEFHVALLNELHAVPCASDYGVTDAVANQHRLHVNNAILSYVKSGIYFRGMNRLSNGMLSLLLTSGTLIQLGDKGTVSLTKQIVAALLSIANIVLNDMSVDRMPESDDLATPIRNGFSDYQHHEHIVALSQWWRADKSAHYLLRGEIAGILINTGQEFVQRLSGIITFSKKVKGGPQRIQDIVKHALASVTKIAQIHTNSLAPPT